MAETKREIERKYDSDDGGLPDLTGVTGVAAVLDKGVAELDATYYDTADARLLAASLTLRRRTGGSDAGWHRQNGKPAAGANASVPPVTAGDHVLVFLRAQRAAIIGLDPAVRRDLPRSVHRMRVATRRMRSAFRSHAKVLDRTVTDPIGEELMWLAGELGADRDQEVLTDRLTAALEALPRPLVTGPVRNRLRAWARAHGGGSRRRLVAVLDGERYLALLATLDRLVDEPPLLPAAAGPPEKVLAKAVRKDFGQVAALVEEALGQPPGAGRDLALHDARKKVKRTRYCAETAAPALGGPAADLVRLMKSLQGLLGDHQDSVMTREALCDLAARAHAAGESAFTYGVLYAREERRAELAEAALPEAWESIGRRWRSEPPGFRAFGDASSAG